MSYSTCKWENRTGILRMNAAPSDPRHRLRRSLVSRYSCFADSDTEQAGTRNNPRLREFHAHCVRFTPGEVIEQGFPHLRSRFVAEEAAWHLQGSHTTNVEKQYGIS